MNKDCIKAMEILQNAMQQLGDLKYGATDDFVLNGIETEKSKLHKSWSDLNEHNGSIYYFILDIMSEEMPHVYEHSYMYFETIEECREEAKKQLKERGNFSFYTICDRFFNDIEEVNNE